MDFEVVVVVVLREAKYVRNTHYLTIFLRFFLWGRLRPNSTLSVATLSLLMQSCRGTESSEVRQRTSILKAPIYRIPRLSSVTRRSRMPPFFVFQISCRVVQDTVWLGSAQTPTNLWTASSTCSNSRINATTAWSGVPRIVI